MAARSNSKGHDDSRKICGDLGQGPDGGSGGGGTRRTWSLRHPARDRGVGNDRAQSEISFSNSIPAAALPGVGAGAGWPVTAVSGRPAFLCSVASVASVALGACRTWANRARLVRWRPAKSGEQRFPAGNNCSLEISSSVPRRSGRKRRPLIWRRAPAVASGQQNSISPAIANGLRRLSAPLSTRCWNRFQRGGAVAARVAHNHEVAGLNPAPATSVLAAKKQASLPHRADPRGTHAPQAKAEARALKSQKSRRHTWSSPHRLEHETQRACWVCGIIKVTRHEHDLHWTEFRDGDGKRIHCAGTPPCQPRTDRVS